MNKKHAAKLTAIAALLGAFYLPQAMADETVAYGTLSLPVASGAKFFDTAITSGSFTDTFTFSVTHAAAISGNLHSSLQFPTAGTPAGFTTGTELTKLTLTDLTTGHSETINAVPGAITHPTSHLSAQTDTITLPTDYLKVGDSYQLQVFGAGGSLLNSLHSKSSYISGLTVSAVPEPEEWAMLLLGLPVMGWAARRKQGLSAA